jgi:hypothetical protein
MFFCVCGQEYSNFMEWYDGGMAFAGNLEEPGGSYGI